MFSLAKQLEKLRWQIEFTCKTFKSSPPDSKYNSKGCLEGINRKIKQIERTADSYCIYPYQTRGAKNNKQEKSH